MSVQLSLQNITLQTTKPETRIEIFPRSNRKEKSRAYRCAYRSETSSHFTSLFRSPSEHLRAAATAPASNKGLFT